MTELLKRTESLKHICHPFVKLIKFIVELNFTGILYNFYGYLFFNSYFHEN